MTTELTVETYSVLEKQVTMAIKSGFLPASIKSPEQAITIALKGRELGIQPLQAFSQIHIIQGKPTISSELMLALIYRNCKGAVINYLESTSDACVIEACRPGGKMNTFSFNIEEAKSAGLLQKENWRKYPDAMLRARCIAIVARAVFPDAIMGASYTAEELGGEEVSLEGKSGDLRGNGVVVTPRATMIDSGTYKKRDITELDPKQLADFIRLREGLTTPSIEQLQELDRAKEFQATQRQLEPSQALPESDPGSCGCGAPLRYSDNKRVWYCSDFRKEGVEHIRPFHAKKESPGNPLPEKIQILESSGVSWKDVNL